MKLMRFKRTGGKACSVVYATVPFDGEVWKVFWGRKVRLYKTATWARKFMESKGFELIETI